jgi:hypothetical protein
MTRANHNPLTVAQAAPIANVFRQKEVVPKPNTER